MNSKRFRRPRPNPVFAAVLVLIGGMLLVGGVAGRGWLNTSYGGHTYYKPVQTYASFYPGKIADSYNLDSYDRNIANVSSQADVSNTLLVDTSGSTYKSGYGYPLGGGAPGYNLDLDVNQIANVDTNVNINQTSYSENDYPTTSYPPVYSPVYVYYPVPYHHPKPQPEPTPHPTATPSPTPSPTVTPTPTPSPTHTPTPTPTPDTGSMTGTQQTRPTKDTKGTRGAQTKH